VSIYVAEDIMAVNDPSPLDVPLDSDQATYNNFYITMTTFTHLYDVQHRQNFNSHSSRLIIVMSFFSHFGFCSTCRVLLVGITRPTWPNTVPRLMLPRDLVASMVWIRRNKIRCYCLSLPNLSILTFCDLQSALGWDHQTELSKHESQKDGSKGFGGKYGVQKDRQDKVGCEMNGG